MQIKYTRQKISGFDYLLQKLGLQSGVGRESVAAQHWYVPGEESLLDLELGRIGKLCDFIRQGKTATLEKLRLKFSQIWDIRGTFRLLENDTVDDVQFFEIKRFAILIREAALLQEDLIRACAFHPVPRQFPDLNPVVTILDPRNEGLPTFHIYDEYDAELAKKRKELLSLDATTPAYRQYGCECASSGTENRPASTENGESANELKIYGARIAALQSECEEMERIIREKLAIRLRPFLPSLKEAMQQVAYWDLLTSKAYLAREYGLVRPDLIPGGTAAKQASIEYRGLFHPMVKEILESRSHRYQPIDIRLRPEPCLLTGANMSGKTVLMKSLALSQCLLQFGFPVPARNARLCLFDSVELLVQDDQDEERGLSSFGAEMQRLNQVIASIRGGKQLLLLIDELARTTNPTEGKAIVSAVLESLSGKACISLVSTHYGPIPNPVRRLRVRGFREEWVERTGEDIPEPKKNLQKKQADIREIGNTPEKEDHFDISRIQACMDYSLVEEKAGEKPPMEALRIASLLGFDPEVLGKALKYYREND